MLRYVVLSCCLLFTAFQQAPTPPIYRELSDLCHPTPEDLQKLQQFLQEGERPELKRLGDKEGVARGIQILGEEPPSEHFWAVHEKEEKRENCVIIYASFNDRYPQGALRLAEEIARSDFKGHVRLKIGGWPDLEGGSLALAHVPFAFKACFFREVQKMGYKRVLWLDASVLPVVSLNEIFKRIEKQGYFVQEGYHLLTKEFFLDEKTAGAFGLGLDEAAAMKSCSAAILGLDLTQDKPQRLLQAWYEAAFDPYAFFSARSDQTALSILLHQFQMTDWAPLKTLAYSRKAADKKRHLFVMDREFVKEEKMHYPLSREPIDVVIPCAKKDASLLPLCIRAIRKQGENIRRVIVVSSEKLTDEAEWFDEKRFPFSKREIAGQVFRGHPKAAKRFYAKPRSRLGWIFQQLIKLYAPLVIPQISSNVLILDADVVFVQKTAFMDEEGHPLFNVGEELYPPYFEHMGRVLPGLRRIHPHRSGVTHHMLFQRAVIEDFFQQVARHHRGLAAWKVFSRCIDRTLANGLSEYEMYFNFFQLRSDQAVLRPLKFVDVRFVEDLDGYAAQGISYITSHIYGDVVP